MQNTQNADPVRHHDVGCNIGRSRHNKLACSGNPARTTAFGKVEKAACSADDLLVDVDRRPRINVTEDVVAIVERVLRRQASSLTRRGLAQGRCPALAKMRIGIRIFDVGSRVLECLQNLGTEPRIMGLAMADKLQRQSTFIRSSG